MSNILPVYRRNYLPLSSEFDEIFNSFFNSFSDTGRYRNQRLVTSPRANITENDQGYNLSLAAPGLSREDFNINVENGVMTVSATSENNEKSNSYSEFNYQNFKRSWSLPEGIQAESITANYQAGILNITVPTEVNKKKAINITVD